MPTSIATRLPALRNRRVLLVQLVVAAVVLGFVGRALYEQWASYRGTPLVVHPRWGWILASGALVLVTYAVLIQTWRAILTVWDARLGFRDAARIWTVSNLGRYVPGKVWQIGAMGVLAQRAGVSPVAAAGSAILSTVVNIACGIAVAMAAGWASLDILAAGHAAFGFVILGAVALGLVTLPFALPVLLDRARKYLGREIPATTFPPRAAIYAVIGNLAAWVLYGVAFEFLVIGVVGEAIGTPADYIAVYAATYVLGYLALVVPGGLGIRDGAIAYSLTALQLATPQQAAVIMIASRLALTILEIAPGLIFLAWGRAHGVNSRPGSPGPASS